MNKFFNYSTYKSLMIAKLKKFEAQRLEQFETSISDTYLFINVREGECKIQAILSKEEVFEALKLNIYE